MKTQIHNGGYKQSRNEAAAFPEEKQARGNETCEKEAAAQVFRNIESGTGVVAQQLKPPLGIFIPHCNAPWETWMEFLIPSFSMVQSWLLWTSGRQSDMDDLSFSLPFK